MTSKISFLTEKISRNKGRSSLLYFIKTYCKNRGQLLAFFFFIFLMPGCTERAENGPVSLEKNWKYQIGDDLSFRLMDFDDSGWSSTFVGDTSLGVLKRKLYNGYTWYRKKIVIPSSLKLVTYTDSLQFYFGAIANNDQFYLNGHLIGENGKIVDSPDAAAIFDIDKPLTSVQRKYVLPFTNDLLLWDQENTIALRVFNDNSPNGPGSGSPFINTLDLTDYIKFNKDFYRPVNNGPVNKSLVVKNDFPEINLTGKLKVKAQDLNTQNILFSQEFPVNIGPKAETVIPIHIPFTTEKVEIKLEYQDDVLQDMVLVTDTIPFVLH